MGVLQIPSAPPLANSSSPGAAPALPVGYILFGGSASAASSASLQWDDTAKALAMGGALSVTEVARTGLTASTPFPSVTLNLAATKTWAAGALAAQADFLVSAGTHAFAGASTETNAATFAISGPPIVGANCTQVNPLALHVRGGSSQFDGPVVIGTTQILTSSPAMSVGSNFVLSGTSNLILRPAAASTVIIDTGNGVRLESGNLTVGTGGTSGASAAKCLVLSTSSAAPSASAAMAHLYAANGNGANTACLSIWQEYAPYAGVAVASTTKIPVRANGTTYYLLATTVP